ncbi:hypothetical protein L1887_57203 [Cichorium endivia]|nr:hypothetical protein L1887_57203 [Cichorium endivia]
MCRGLPVARLSRLLPGAAFSTFFGSAVAQRAQPAQPEITSRCRASKPPEIARQTGLSPFISAVHSPAIQYNVSLLPAVPRACAALWHGKAGAEEKGNEGSKAPRKAVRFQVRRRMEKESGGRRSVVHRLELGDAGTGEEAAVGLDAVDAVVGIEVLVEHKLEHGAAALAGHDDARPEEEAPHAVHVVAVLGHHLVLVRLPVLRPSQDGRRVVHAGDVDRADLEAGLLEMRHHPAERARGVGAGEDVFVHEEAPVEVVELPPGSQAGHLEDKDTVVVEQVVHVREELVVVADADVLGHLERDDLGVVARLHGNVAVVEVEDARLAGVDAVLLESVVAEARLRLGERHTGHVAAVVDGGKGGEGAPAASDVEHAVLLLQVELGADEVELVVLQLLERLRLVGVRDDARGVDHLRAEEPRVKVVAPVVVVLDLRLVLLGGVHEHVGDEVEQHVLKQRPGELHRAPVPAVLEQLVERQLGLDLAGKVGVVEGLVRDLLVRVVLLAQGGVLDVHVVLERLAGQLHLFVDARAVGGHDGPVGDGDGRAKEGAEQQVAEPSEPLGVDERDQTQHDGWGEEDEEREVEVGEGAVALCGEGSVGDGRVVGELDLAAGSELDAGILLVLDGRSGAVAELEARAVGSRSRLGNGDLGAHSRLCRQDRLGLDAGGRLRGGHGVRDVDGLGDAVRVEGEVLGEAVVRLLCLVRHGDQMVSLLVGKERRGGRRW